MTANRPGDRGRSGFTILEISIVLVIIGLIVGGVLVGRDLIHAATIRSDISTITEIQTAINTFKLKYNCLPGDCANASAFGLGSNGNGDGMIEQYNINVVPHLYESVFAWQHLGAAGLIRGNYDADPNGATNLTCGPSTCPQSKINTGDALFLSGVADVYTFLNSVPIYGSGLTSNNANIGIFWLSTDGVDSNMNVNDAFALDSKLDDGIADTGRFITANQNWGVGNCVTGYFTVTNGTANYNMQDTVNDCFVTFILPVTN